MRKLWAAVLAVWAFIADTAQIAGVEWKPLLGIAMGAGGGAWLIGVITEAGPLQVAVAVTAVMFLAAGASAFSRYKKFPLSPAAPTPPLPVDELAVRLLRAKARADPKQPEAPRYEPPPNQTYESMAQHSNAVLGEFLITAGSQIEKFVKDYQYKLENAQIAARFIEVHGQIFFGLYQEARRRGYHNNSLDTYFEYPDNIQNFDSIKWIGQDLRKFGAQVKIRARQQV